jgi:hypothetical protein
MEVPLNAKGLVLAGCCIFAISNGALADPSHAHRGNMLNVDTNAAILPVAFEPNRGQSATPVKFLTRAAGYQLFLTGDEDVFVLGDGATSPHGDPRDALRAVRIKLLGAVKQEQLVGGGTQPGVVNYLLGRDPAGWNVGIPTYGSVTRRAAWPGIDVVYYADAAGRIETDFIAAPGADLSAIELAFQGSDGVTVDRAGTLVIAVGHRTLMLLKPAIYQAVAGRKLPVDGQYVVDAGNPDEPHVHFDVTNYDHSRSLIIDPQVQLVYASFLRGSGFDEAEAVSVTSPEHNAFVAGRTKSADFPANDGPLTGTQEGFVAKLGADGKLVFATFIGGGGHNSETEVRAIATRAGDEIFITGVTDAKNFPTTEHAFQRDAPGKGAHPFVTVLHGNGQSFIFSTYLGSTENVQCRNSDPGTDWPVGIAVNALHEIYIAGNTCSAKFPVWRPIQLADAVDFPAAFVTRLSSDGRKLMNSTYLGGHGLTMASGIALDPHLVEASAYVAGTTSARDFPVKHAFQAHLNGYTDAFVAKFSLDGASLVYSSYLGGDNGDEARGIAVDSFGDAYLVGNYSSLKFPAIHALKSLGSYPVPGVFVARIAHNGDLQFCVGFGGFDTPSGNAIAELNGAYVTGTTSAVNFPTINPYQKTLQGGRDAFVAKISKDGKKMEYSTYLGGSGNDEGEAIAVDGTGDAYVVGRTGSNAFPTGEPRHPAPLGDASGFVVKLHLDKGADGNSPQPQN